MELTPAREGLKALLDAAFPTDWGVTDHLPDSVAPPCALIGWADPWLKPITWCTYSTVMEIICVAQRLEPGGKLETLEQMVATILPALRKSPYTVIDVTAPYPIQIGGVDYLAASVNLEYETEKDNG